jgi:DNA mismatch repair protein MutS
LHKVVPGGADRSYGVHVARLAGMPRPVVDRARELLQQLEDNGSNFKHPPFARELEPPSDQPRQLDMFTSLANPAVDALRGLNIDELSPLEALTKLYELKRLVEDQ